MDRSTVEHIKGIFKKNSYLRIFCDFKRQESLKDAYNLIAHILRSDPKTDYAFWGWCSWKGCFPNKKFTNVVCQTYNASHLNYKGYKNIIAEKDVQYRKGYKIICILNGEPDSNKEYCIRLGMPKAYPLNDVKLIPKKISVKEYMKSHKEKLMPGGFSAGDLAKASSNLFANHKPEFVKLEESKPKPIGPIGPFGFVSFKED